MAVEESRAEGMGFADSCDFATPSPASAAVAAAWHASPGPGYDRRLTAPSDRVGRRGFRGVFMSGGGFASGADRGIRALAGSLVRASARVAIVLCVTLAAAAEPPAGTSLESRIDAIVEAAAVGPIAPPCSDADFLRRAFLDLAGTIPSADRARAFLADPSPDKRARLVDELLAAPTFARHFALVLDAALLERKNAGGELAPAWRAFLVESVAADRPLDETCGLCIASDGADPATRGAAAFFLARDAEPVQMTRSIGRVFFGRDLQCAQCHDHPNNADIRQADHHGLAAFIQRTSLFKSDGDPKAVLAEKAEGEVDFTSVFTSDTTKAVRPRLPEGATLVAEPLAEPGDEWTTAPAKNVRGVPSHSRRKALAAMLRGSTEFRRTMANRVWAALIGRGLVHPLDGHDPDNAPVHPELLTLLADSLRDGGFRLKGLVRAIALSRVYGRGVEPPAIDATATTAAAALVEPLAAARKTEDAALAPLQTAATEALARFDALLAEDRTLLDELLPLVDARNKARTAADKTADEKKAADGELAKKQSQAESLAGAAAKAAEAAAILPDDKVLAGAAEIVAARSAEFAATVEAAKGAVAAKAAELDAATKTLAAARQACDAVTAKRPSREALAAADEAAIAARAAWRDAKYALARTDLRLALVRDILRLPEVAADPVAAAALRQAIVARQTDLGQVARLRALSPEQFAFGLLTATGSYESFRSTAEKKLESEPPEVLKNAAPEAAPAIRAVALETRTIQEASGFLSTVAGLQGDPLAADFQTSVNQALWLGNSPEVAGWVQGAATTLAGKAPDPAAIADEAFLAVLSRHPDDAERADVAATIASRSDDRPAAVAEVLWALLASSEYRFNH